MRNFVAVLLLVSAAWAEAGSLDANLNDNSVSLTLGWEKNSKAPDAMQFQVGVLHNVQSNRVINAGIHVIGETGSRENPMELGVGGKLLAIDSAASGIFYGLALGVDGTYYPRNVNRLALSAQYYYSPNVVVSSGAKNYQEFTVRAEYQVLPQAFVYMGYRTFILDLNTGVSENLDSGVHFGVRVLFQ